MAHTVLLATEKPFAASAVTGIESTFQGAAKHTFTLRKLEKYTTKEELLAAVKDVQAMIIRSDKCDKEVLDAAAELKIVVRAGAGVDNIDLNAATAKGVCAMNTPGQNSNAVAELAFGMLITNARNHYDGSSGFELKGRTLGLYGCGNVSRHMIRLATGFGMNCVGFDPFLTPEQISEMGAKPASAVEELFGCHVVSLHVPATEQTKKSINYDLLMKMPQSGVLVNTARKEVVDEEGLIKALQERGDLAYLCDVGFDSTDALEASGINKGNPRVFCTKKKMGAQTAEANNNAGVAAANQIVKFFEDGDTTCQVNKEGRTF